MNRECKSFEQQSTVPLGLGGWFDDSGCAFSWGYADLLDEEGSGVVLIWGFSLPFLPGTVTRSRAGEQLIPGEEASVCVAVYDRGRPEFYLLEHLPKVDLEQCFPENGRLRWPGLEIDFAESGLEARFDLTVPGSPNVVGTLSFAGVRPRFAHGADDSPHRWAPRLLGTGQASLVCGDWSFAMSGRAYHDGNASRRPLEALGIHRWIWGRVAAPNGHYVYYLVEPEHPDGDAVYLSFHVDDAGEVRMLDPTPDYGEPRRGFWGLMSPKTLSVGGLTVEHVDYVDDGPFYQRVITAVTLPDGTTCPGVGEVVDVPSIDRGVLAPLTRMAPFDPRAPGWWCALFNGPHKGGFRRLVRSWLS